jgi:hypothetical protein
VIVIGVVLTYIFNFLQLQDLMYWVKQIIMIVIVLLLMRPTLFVFMGWIAVKLGLTKQDFIKKTK